MSGEDFERQTLTMLADIRERVARLEACNGPTIEALQTSTADHEERIRAIEEQHAKDKGRMILPASVGAAVGGAIVAGADVAFKLWGSK